MGAHLLQELIRKGESREVEFKSDRGPLSDAELLEAVVCLANDQGGVLLIGVEDDGTVTGLHESHRTNPKQLEAFVAARTQPPLLVRVSFESLEGHIVAVVEVPKVSQPVATSDGRLVIRYLDTHGRPGCRPLYPYELSSWRADRGLFDYTAQPVEGASWQDLDPLEFERLRRLVQEYRGDSQLLVLDDQQLARALNLVFGRGQHFVPTVAGLLLVGREEALRTLLPAHEVALQVLERREVRLNEFYRWPLLRIFERIMEAFSVRNEERELTVGLFRVGIPAYDPRAFREAVNNALTHRDYTRLGAVHIQLREDHVLISNPGGFVEGVTIHNILVAGPKPRNPVLADAFKRIGLVERTGRGVSIIYEGLLRTGHLPPDYSRTTHTSVTLILPGGPSDLDFVSLIVQEENKRQRPFSVEELLLLNYLWREREVDLKEAARLIQQDEVVARRVLEHLLESGLVEGRGRTRARRYHLSLAVYRETGKRAEYVRRRGFDRPQMEQMILEYVRLYGRITRREVMDLCRVSAHQAAYLLRRLAKDGHLEVVGAGRAAFYRLKR
ncbi:MAG: putative DNA binding domain-containing protein [Thermoflexales bacterium]|nr:putative DNA binding domain-containing protein [Thermoflexales bacterium]